LESDDRAMRYCPRFSSSFASLARSARVSVFPWFLQQAKPTHNVRQKPP
jgi:hypothetical protein